MCGLIAAFFNSDAPIPALNLGLEQMKRRGPDGQGVWSDAGVYLGHQRLAIQDLDDRSLQPMESICGRYTIVFNGEIYNFKSLKAICEAAGEVFKTTSDTELLLSLFKLKGESMLPELRGMFAFVIWDKHLKKAFIARDPYGIKPLYFSEISDGVIVASQVKSIMRTGLVSTDPCLDGQAGFWLLGSVPEPYTWYRKVRAVSAGGFMWIKHGKILSQRIWWDISDAWRGEQLSGEIPDNITQEIVRKSLKSSIKAHLISDVPIGIFLSGGKDSASLASMMVEAGYTNLHGITISFDEQKGGVNDESLIAQSLAWSLGIKHHIRNIGRAEFYEDLPKILEAMDQPTVDGINTWFASKAASELGLKVVISGVGGDELFQGYEHFRVLPRIVRALRFFKKIPGGLSLIKRLADLMYLRSYDQRWLLLEQYGQSLSSALLLRRMLFCPSEIPTQLRKTFIHSPEWNFSPCKSVERISGSLPNSDILALGLLESTCYLRNQLLRDSDWASMYHGVELRTPLVDSWLLEELRPVISSFERFPHKSLLTNSSVHKIERDQINKKKNGFNIPLMQWRNKNSSTKKNSRSTVKDWAQEVAARCYEY